MNFALKLTGFPIVRRTLLRLPPACNIEPELLSDAKCEPFQSP